MKVPHPDYWIVHTQNSWNVNPQRTVEARQCWSSHDKWSLYFLKDFIRNCINYRGKPSHCMIFLWAALKGKMYAGNLQTLQEQWNKSHHILWGKLFSLWIFQLNLCFHYLKYINGYVCEIQFFLYKLQSLVTL